MKKFKESILYAEDKVLVKFGANWCGPCRSIEPTLEKMSEDGYNVYKVDTDEEPELTTKYGIRSVPTLIMFEDSKESRRMQGAASIDSFINFYNGE